MSELDGKFKAKFVKFETSTKGQAPCMRAVFKLTDQWIESDWESLQSPIEGDDSVNMFCSYTYWLNKEKKYADSKCSPFEFSESVFESAYGFKLTKYRSLAALNEKLSGVEKILILERDVDDKESPHHTVKYVNNLAGKTREGMVDLGDLL